jgi:hypothetical protein
MWIAASTDAAFYSLVQSLRSNESLHLASVENPPIEAVQLIFEQGSRFLSFPDSGASLTALCRRSLNHITG